MSKHQSIYLMQCGTYYKLGISNDPQKRFKTFQTGNPKIKLVCFSDPISYAHRLEHALHKILKKKNVNGEWFKLTSEDLLYIRKIIENLTEDKRLEELAETLLHTKY